MSIMLIVFAFPLSSRKQLFYRNFAVLHKEVLTRLPSRPLVADMKRSQGIWRNTTGKYRVKNFIHSRFLMLLCLFMCAKQCKFGQSSSFVYEVRQKNLNLRMQLFTVCCSNICWVVEIAQFVFVCR